MKTIFARALSMGRVVMASLLLGGLAACGGGGGSAGTPVLGGGSSNSLLDLSVTGNTTLPNTGTDTLTVTVTALTTGNAALTDVAVPVTFSVDAGAVVTAAGKTTNTTDGKATATVSLTDRTNRTVTVTVTSGSIQKKFTFDVVDSITGSKVADISLVADKTNLPNNGTQQLVVTATTLNNLRVAAGGVPISFSVNDPAKSAFVSPAGGATVTGTADGQLGATVSIGSSTANRSISVIASSGTVSRSISFDVIDSAAVNPQATDMTMTLSKTSIGNSGNETVAVVVTAVDSKRNAVSGIDVSFTVDNGAVLVVGNSKTASDGTAKASVTIGSDRSNRLITVTAASSTLTRQASFRVTGAKLQGTLQPATLKVGDTGQVTYSLADVNTNPMVGVPVMVSGPGAAASATGVTDNRGQYVYTYVAAGSGPTPINAIAGGALSSSTVQIDAKLSDVPAATVISSATFTVAPSVVNVNAVGSKDNRAELRLLFLTANNQPIPNVRVRLGMGTNASGTDGVIGSGNDAVITSDASGVAVSSFIAGQRASSTDQVTVFACYAKDDTVEQIAACPTARTLSVSLTVVEQPVSISIGTNNLIAPGATDLTYIQQFTVLVVDSAGNPKSGVQLSPVLDLPSYLKGKYAFDPAKQEWNFETSKAVVPTPCINEDNSVTGFRNGTIDTAGATSEDINGSGQLDPRKSDVSIAMVGSTTTDANGLAVLRIEYPQNYGSWVEYSIRVSASGVVSPPAWYGRIARPGMPLSSLPGVAQYTGVPISAIKAQGTPPFAVSPYGQSASCSNPN